MRLMNMKKNYSKPSVYFEDFSLMDAITAGCGYPAQHANQMECSCEIEYGGMRFTIFTDGNEACDAIYQPYEVGITDVIFPS